MTRSSVNQDEIQLLTKPDCAIRIPRGRIGLADEGARECVLPGVFRGPYRAAVAVTRGAYTLHDRGVDIPVGVAESGHALAAYVLQRTTATVDLLGQRALGRLGQ